MAKHVDPAITLHSFSCPHCDAHTGQTWFNVYGRRVDRGGLPSHWTPESAAEFRKRARIKEEKAELRASLDEFVTRSATGEVFLEGDSTVYDAASLVNVSVSRCYSCKRVAVWIYDHVVYPPVRHGEEPNPDLPEEIRVDFEEARTILDLSPRGAAALLRLCIQKLCAHLGEKGKDINDDIASLVRKGLNPRIQQALDVVRVIGNEAVHPGTVDLRDDRDTAVELLALVNLIAEKMISEPKRVETMYARLPAAKRAAIEERDKGK